MNAHSPFKRLKAVLIVLSIRINILLIAFVHYRNPLKALKAVKMLAKRRVAFSGVTGIPKFFSAGGRFFFNPNIPGWPSLSFTKFIENELNNITSNTDIHKSRLTTVVFSITKKCHLNCQHCFEWDRLNGTELLTENDLYTILNKFQKFGVCQFQLGGGEPMLRFDDLIKLIKKSQKGTDFWLLTSGYNLTKEKAIRLKKSGLTGVKISLDHWDKEKHNGFRGNDKSFEWAIEAATNCREAGLAMGVAACITSEFLSEDYLTRYLNLAREIKADFVFFLEPRETGHFSNIDVSLTDEEIGLVEKFYLNINSNSLYYNYPMIIFPGHHQRKIGCYGAGHRFLYIDSEGAIHACPFCQGKLGDAIQDDLNVVIPELRKKGCHKFHSPVVAVS